MTTSGVDDVGAYLERVRTLRPAQLLDEANALDELRAELSQAADAHPERLALAMADLGKRRLLASTTLGARNVEERLAWDEANRWLHRHIEGVGSRWTVASLVALNAAVLQGASGLRCEPLYSPPDRYLDPSRVAPELDALLAHEADAPPLLAASFYIAIVTIHPFADGNGRTARLAADGILLAHGYLPLSFTSSVASHVAQMQGGAPRDAIGSLRKTLAAVRASYRLVLDRLGR